MSALAVRILCRVLVALGGLAILAGPLAAVASGADRCGAIADRIERTQGIPPGLLQALALAESGRAEQGTHRAWPWAVRSGDEGFYLPSKAAALAKVEELRAAGRSNIDVGCMQINLGYHGEAFGSLEDAFDPIHNVAYGADFLRRLQRQTGSWAKATGRYHSADRERGQAYRARVYRIWRALRRRQGHAAPKLAEASFVGGPMRLTGSATAVRRDDAPSRLVSPPSRGGRSGGLVVLRGR